MSLPPHVERRVADLEQTVATLKSLLQATLREPRRVDRPAIRLARTAPQESGSPAYPAEPANTYKLIYLDDESSYAPGLITPSTTDLSATEMGLGHLLGGKGQFVEDETICLVAETNGGKRYIIDPTPSTQWAAAELNGNLASSDEIATVTSAVSLNTGEALAGLTNAANFLGEYGVDGSPALVVRESAESQWLLVRVQPCCPQPFAPATGNTCTGALNKVLNIVWSANDGETEFGGAAELIYIAPAVWMAASSESFGTFPDQHPSQSDIRHIKFSCELNAGVDTFQVSWLMNEGGLHQVFETPTAFVGPAADFPLPVTETITTAGGTDVTFTLSEAESPAPKTPYSATAASWASSNPVLAKGQVGIESNTLKEKTGDGVTAWNDLPYSYDGGEQTETNTAAITAAESDIDDLEADVGAAETDIATNASGISSNASGIATNTADITTNAAAIATLETDVAAAESDIDDLEAAVAQAASDIDDAETAIAANTSSIATNAAAIATADTKFADRLAIVATNNDDTISANEFHVVDITTNNPTLALDDTYTAGDRVAVRITDKDAVGQYCLIDPGAKTIDGSSTDIRLDVQGWGLLLQYDGTNWQIISDERFPAWIHATDEKSNGSGGGTFPQDVWQTRDLNTLDDPYLLASLASNTITLQAGVYRVKGSAPAYQVANHQAVFRNVDANSTAALGSSEYTGTASANTQRSFFADEFTITAETDFDVRHFCKATVNTFGFGTNASTGAGELFTDVELWKLK